MLNDALELELYNVGEQLLIFYDAYKAAHVKVIEINFPMYKVEIVKDVSTLKPPAHARYKEGELLNIHHTNLQPINRVKPQKPYNTNTLLRLLIAEIKELRNDLQK